jgi:hypothetical protein
MLQVAPVMRSMQRVAADGMVLSRGSMTAISVQLEGRWLPLEEVAGEAFTKGGAPCCCKQAREIQSVLFARDHAHQVCKLAAKHRSRCMCVASSAAVQSHRHVSDLQLRSCCHFTVDVVGKYRYEAKDPLGREPLVIVVDVLLVGRTKMLKLHSALWVQNNTGIKMSLQLQLPDSVGGAWAALGCLLLGWPAANRI